MVGLIRVGVCDEWFERVSDTRGVCDDCDWCVNNYVVDGKLISEKISFK